ncbi:MAG: prepilin-type N-terminal cleavage/methylation domain-containing protein [Armatimonadetes bacterium]|nr:prepilin-type N-terminal cleavage/methylation domain-containing protein [Armatimonadota bacterium]
MITRRQSGGFTLIEVMAVVFILAVGLTAVSGLFITGLVSSRKAERLNAATNAVQQQMERLRSAGFSGCSVDPDIFSSDEGYSIVQQNDDGTGQIGFAVPELPGGTGTIDIAFFDPGSGSYPNLKDITITVSWTGGKPTGGTTVFQTLVANRP